MTNQEAIKWLREAEILDLASGNTKDREAVNMAISALEKQKIKQKIKESGCTYKPDCPWYDGSKCNSPNDPGYHECDYDRGIFPKGDYDKLDEVMQHWIKQADEQEKVAEMYPEYADECEKISNDFRQLASWLQELKERRNVMSVLIKDMEMPKNCWRCPLLIVDDNHNLKMKMCCITHTHAYDTEGRLSDCPLEVQDQNMELEGE